MRTTGGTVEDHDHEFDEVEWLPLDEALRLMTYDTDRAVVEEALAQLATQPTAGVGGSARQ
jgi:hypothetical protein